MNATRRARPQALALPLVTVDEALAELRAGRCVGLRHRGGHALIAPASLASVPLVEAIETAAGSPVTLVLGAHDVPREEIAPTAQIGTPAARAAAIHDTLRHRRRPDGTAALTVVGARPGGVLGHGAAAGPAEAALDLVRAADFGTGALLAPVRARPDAETLLATRDVAFVHISEVAALVGSLAAPVARVVTVDMPTPHGHFKAIGYRASLQGMEFVASVRGEPAGRHAIPASVHDGCLFGDVLRSVACGCRAQFTRAMTRIGSQECGIVIRLEPDASTVFGEHGPPDRRRMALAVQVIRDLAPASVVLVHTDEAVADALVEQGCPIARP